MAWDPILWIIFTIINLTLIGLNFYQFLGFSDLEADYLNPYELSSRINYVIVPEYLLHGAFCILFLMTGHWIVFLLSLPPAYYNLKQYLSKQHLIDVTEVFKVVNAEKKARIIKLVFYVLFFGLVITRTIAAGTISAVLSVLFSSSLLYLSCMLYSLMMTMLWIGLIYIEFLAARFFTCSKYPSLR